jgi:hypothetical protein
VDNGYAMSLGLAFSIGDQMKHMMANSGWDPPVSQAPTIGRCRFRPPSSRPPMGSCMHFVDPDYCTRMAIDDVLAALRSAK